MTRRDARLAEAQWPDALELLIGSFRSGLNTEAAITFFYENAPQPLRGRLHRRIGKVWEWLPVEKRISILFDGAPLNLVRSALLVSLGQGGKQAKLLETAARLLRNKLEYEQRLQGLTAHARATSWIVGLSPLFIGGVVALVAPEFVGPLFSTRQGIWLLLSAASLITVGLWTVQKMSRMQS